MKCTLYTCKVPIILLPLLHLADHKKYRVKEEKTRGEEELIECVRSDCNSKVVSSRLDLGKGANVVYLDFWKAFNSVPHKRLVQN